MRLKVGFVLALTAGCLAWVLWGVNLGEAALEVAEAQIAWVLPAWALFFACHAVRTLRLRALIGEPLPFWPLFGINAIGFLAINVIPLRLGEFVRPTLLLEQHGVPFGRSLAAIFVERLMDVLMLFMLLLWLAFFVELPPQGVLVGDVDVVLAGQRFAATTLAVGGLGLVGLLTVGEPAIQLMERVFAKLPIIPKIAALLRSFRAGITSLLGAPLRALGVLSASMALWGGTIIAVGCVLLAFDGLPHSLVAAGTTWTLTITGMTVAPTPGFFGSYEAFCKASLLLWDVPAQRAATFAVVLHLVQLGFTIVLGGSALALAGVNLRRVVLTSWEKGDKAPPPTL